MPGRGSRRCLNNCVRDGVCPLGASIESMLTGRTSAFGRELAAVVFVCSLSGVACAVTVQESLEYVRASKDYVEITTSEDVAIDLRYATPNNFIGQNLYGAFNRAFLHRIAAEKMVHAVTNLRAINPKYKLVIFDVLRPRSVQHVLWNRVRGTGQERYVADPKVGSIHNFGFAVDLSILDEYRRELDM